ncbi:hypothetical protein BDZ89DRAFT_175566 [Hymenopellis radicata]|nr:hypothetical protein BDZ89DRAFT_175566 [Hymenopellis radicata]
MLVPSLILKERIRRDIACDVCLNLFLQPYTTPCAIQYVLGTWIMSARLLVVSNRAWCLSVGHLVTRSLTRQSDECSPC